MTKQLEGKKLLLLGGVQPACQIVEEAHKMGVTVYVTDYLANSPAKAIADKSFMVNAMDVDAVVDLCKAEGIDGLITGYVDSLLPYAEMICNKLGFPFWGNALNIEMCINKETFKEACEKSGLPVVPWRKINRDNYLCVGEKIEFPVVIKPVDNSGSRGVFKCYDKESYAEFCLKAFEFSKCGVLLVERLMNVHNEFSAYYMINHGKAILTGMGDRFVNIIDESIAPVGQGMQFPSKKLTLWCEKVDNAVQRFFSDNLMNEGFIFIQGFHEEENFYIHEIGYRLNGGFSYKIIEHFSEYNQVQELIRFSLTGSVDANEVNKSNPAFDGYGFILTFALQPGEIKEICGVDDAAKVKGVIDFCQLHNVGDRLVAKGTTAQVFAYVLCAGKTLEDLKLTIKTVKNLVSVKDIEGNELLYTSIDIERIK